MKKSLFILFSVVIGFTACKKTQILTTTPEAAFSTNIINGHDPSESDAIILTNTSSENSNYFWDFGNGKTSTEKSPTAYYAMHGNYNIKLTVTDSKGLAPTTSHEVLILCKFKNKNHTEALPL